MTALVSVLVPAFNAERYIGRCLRSLSAQVFDETFEIIVINDGSEDRTDYALSQFGKSIKVLTNKSNQGLPSSLNRGLELAEGSYVVRVDSDDYVNKYFLTFLYQYLIRNEEFDAVASDYYLVDEVENVISKVKAAEQPIGCGILFHKTQIKDLGGYNEDFLRHEDKEFMLRFAKAYRVGHLNVPLYRYRQHAKNMTLDVELMKFYESKLESEN